LPLPKPVVPLARVSPHHPRASEAVSRSRVLLIAGTAGIVMATVVLIGYPVPPSRVGAEHTVGSATSPVVAVEPAANQPQVSVPTSPAAPTTMKEPQRVVNKPKPTQVASVADPHMDSAPSATASSAAIVIPASTIEPAAREPFGNTADVVVPAPSARASEPAVTIAGCLEESIDDARFRLSDTEGAAAPKSRGWRSGFLKKRPASVELIEPPDVGMLRKLVGRRVAAAGILADRKLRVSSISPLGTTCD
jgi:hypothetical protein